MTSNEPTPSTYTDGYWLWAKRQVGTYPTGTERTGKWIVFVPVTQVDDWWNRVKQAVEEGRLAEAILDTIAVPRPSAARSGRGDPRARLVGVATAS